MLKLKTNRMLLAATFTVLLTTSLAIAQSPAGTKTTPPAKAKSVRPAKQLPAAYQPPEKIDPSLPNVLLLGDSISIGYMLDVRKELEGEANVFRPATNCGPTTNGIKGIEDWLGDRKWSVIHFNFGLHDLKYMGPKGENLADPKKDTSHQQVPLSEYVTNIRAIAERLKQTGAKVIWCQTTPVPEGAGGRVVGDAVKYNEAAAKVMIELGGIATDDLYDFSLANVTSEQRPANVHYTPEGSKMLAGHVVESIRKALKSE